MEVRTIKSSHITENPTRTWLMEPGTQGNSPGRADCSIAVDLLQTTFFSIAVTHYIYSPWFRLRNVLSLSSPIIQTLLAL